MLDIPGVEPELLLLRIPSCHHFRFQTIRPQTNKLEDERYASYREPPNTCGIMVRKSSTSSGVVPVTHLCIPQALSQPRHRNEREV